MAARPHRFVFVVGVSGSGTTMTTRILGGAPGAVCLGGNHVRVPDDPAALEVSRRFNEASARLWDRQADALTAASAGREMVDLLDQLSGLPACQGVTHVVYKRSFPFFAGDRHRPDLRDLFDLFADVRLVVVHRDPRAATASSLRREFGPNLRACAVVIEDQLTYVAAQLATLDPSRCLLTSYEGFCSDPTTGARRLARFCGLDESGLIRAALAERVEVGRNDRWRAELSAADVRFLDRFFDAGRRRQWALLSAGGQEASGAA
jgi:hypothetical protein